MPGVQCTCQSASCGAKVKGSQGDGIAQCGADNEIDVLHVLKLEVARIRQVKGRGLCSIEVQGNEARLVGAPADLCDRKVRGDGFCWQTIERVSSSRSFGPHLPRILRASHSATLSTHGA